MFELCDNLLKQLEEREREVLHLVLLNYQLEKRIDELENKQPLIYVQTNHLEKLKQTDIDFVRVSKTLVSDLKMTPVYER